MDKRLQQFLDLEDLTPSKLADILKIQRSGISHLLSGRNKPSFDFIQGILINFPHINPDWLILGKGKPYRSQTATSVTSPTPMSKDTVVPSSSPYTLFDTPVIKTQESLPDSTQFISETKADSQIEVVSVPSALNDVQSETGPTTPVTQHITKISEASQPSEDRFMEPSSTISPNIQASKRDKRIVRITVFYSDGTFEEK
ncbi:MAG TPA: helix-turn-helix transcriptional regulator [Bacteroidales bacterium]|nr:helix-turn-helix transcriptional regulator [Bacteroidales bacterium]HPK29751.1 helix-turn-helix transcriptional regulator [Bacteroidales bacterium]